ncbi:Universal stress protein UspA-like protein [Frankia sp. AiPs1]|uniref:universal stress protein n=1 Tax=Frankia sp. AiPa1 TaxID=573492 RepID=UPI00202AEC3D|nr:universal stress protein [Frankia sp. AiPa1]MCL9758579.1 universal stress protein [Frankia sp. AiPa1]
MTTTDHDPGPARPVGPAVRTGPVLFAYDGSDVAGYAIRYAATQLAPGREALVLCVWQPADVGFTPISPQHFDAADATAVQKAAAEIAAHGARLADAAGFRAHSTTAEAAPTWKGIVTTATERQVGLIVIGAHRHTGLVGHLLGSVASDVVAHAPGSVLLVHQRESHGADVVR